MQPRNIYLFGQGQTSVHPLGLAFLAVAIVLVLVLKRKYVIVPVLLLAFLVSPGEQYVLGGVHFSMLRILLPIAWIRLLLTGFGDRPAAPFRLSNIDWPVLLYFTDVAVAFTLVWGTFAAFTNRLGFLYNALGMYFLLRYVIRDWDDIYRALRVLSFASLLIAVEMVYEQLTFHDLFALVGGSAVPDFRDGRVRSLAGFSHEILAGSFGAILLPLFVLLWSRGGKSRIWASIGALSSLTIAFTSTSSGPVLACAAGIGALCLWPLRDYTRWMRWGIVGLLAALQLVMHHPIYWLVTKVGVVSGSTSWYRYRIIDLFFTHFWDWWLIGTNQNGNWGLGTWDVTNQFIATGVSGGLAALILLLVILVRAFRAVGIARREEKEDLASAWRIWCIGAAVFVLLVSFFDISFFDQTVYLWYLALALIPAAARQQKAPVEEPVPVPVVAGWRLPARLVSRISLGQASGRTAGSSRQETGNRTPELGTAKR